MPTPSNRQSVSSIVVRHNEIIQRTIHQISIRTFSSSPIPVIYSHVWFELICSRAGSSYHSAGICLRKRHRKQAATTERQVNRLTNPMNSCSSRWGRIVHSQRRLCLITLYAIVWALNQRTHNGNQARLDVHSSLHKWIDAPLIDVPCRTIDVHSYDFRRHKKPK